ncbi:TonB-dependent receptor plug domain-containing protein [Myxococcota bacterium]|nr:TonB-dependent receptor plug domain-containing protein [Myxococcota bacterium]
MRTQSIVRRRPVLGSHRGLPLRFTISRQADLGSHPSRSPAQKHPSRLVAQELPSVEEIKELKQKSSPTTRPTLPPHKTPTSPQPAAPQTPTSPQPAAPQTPTPPQPAAPQTPTPPQPAAPQTPSLPQSIRQTSAPPKPAASQTSTPPQPAAPQTPPRPKQPQRDVTLDDATVLGKRQQRSDAASRFQIELGALQIIPRKDVTEQLMLAPGVLTINHGGEGHAQETYMRGFAAGEGQDIEFLVDGVPLNEVSNPHGHGYTDLYFIPPEFVRSLDITEGVFEASQGDFAFAGTAHYRLGVEERGARLSYRGGMWNTHRLVLMYAPPSEPAETFAGFELYRTDGYGQNRSAQRALGLGRYLLRDTGTFRMAFSVYAYAARFDQAGVIRQDDFLAGRIGFFETYDPNQGGESNRLLLSVDTAFGPREQRFQMVVFAGYRTMRLRNNFTGWLNDLKIDPDGTPVTKQRGDGNEMRYGVLTAGSRGDYTLTLNIAKQQQIVSMGYALRVDHGDSSISRLRSVTAIPYRRIFDFGFTTLNIAGWMQGQLRFTTWFGLRAGVRIDTFGFGVLDRNQPTADREGRRLSDQSSQAFGFAINPRATLDFRLWPALHLLISYGQGTRSTEAAALSDNETAPFARAQVADIGLSYTYGRQGAGIFLKSQLSYVFSYVDKDLIFDEEVGRNVLTSASMRHAVLLGVRMNYNRWLDALVNVGWAHATRLDTGELFPYIPQWVVRADIAVNGPLFGWKVGGRPVWGRVGLGFTFVPGRPLPYQEWGDPFYLLSLGGSMRFWHIELGVEARNLLGFQYRQAEFSYTSNFAGPTAIPPRLPERHFAAGEPLTIMANLTLHLEEMLVQLQTATREEKRKK